MPSEMDLARLHILLSLIHTAFKVSYMLINIGIWKEQLKNSTFCALSCRDGTARDGRVYDTEAKYNRKPYTLYQYTRSNTLLRRQLGAACNSFVDSLKKLSKPATAFNSCQSRQQLVTAVNTGNT